jgi:hypothetical protein
LFTATLQIKGANKGEYQVLNYISVSLEGIEFLGEIFDLIILLLKNVIKRYCNYETV